MHVQGPDINSFIHSTNLYQAPTTPTTLPGSRCASGMQKRSWNCYGGVDRENKQTCYMKLPIVKSAVTGKKLDSERDRE